MNCRDFHEVIDSYLSDELLTETNHDVLRHMEDCGNCRQVIEARREVRSRLKSAVINAPQYQIGKSFTHNLETQLRFAAEKMQESGKTKSRLGFGRWAAAAAGLMLAFTLGFVLLGNFGNSDSPGVQTAQNAYTTGEFPQNHIVNVAFADHQFCAIEHHRDNPVKLVTTPARYENLEQVAMPQLRSILSNCMMEDSHTCEYKGTQFTHLIVKKETETLSVMLTGKNQADKFGKDIAHYSSEKYQLSRFDVNETSVFVVSGFNKETNTQVANALYSPLQKHLSTKQSEFQTAQFLVMKY